MCGSKTIISMVTRNYFIATINLKDAYYSVSIGSLFQKFLKFKWNDKLCCFTCFPNGLGSCLRQLTKLHNAHRNFTFWKFTLDWIHWLFFTKENTFSICEQNINEKFASMVIWNLSQSLKVLQHKALEYQENDRYTYQRKESKIKNFCFKCVHN